MTIGCFGEVVGINEQWQILNITLDNSGPFATVFIEQKVFRDNQISVRYFW
jgi:hypothetical protein